MLILGRKVGEKVKIGDDITVIICASHGGQIRLGFEAPANIEIHREEVFDRIRLEKGKLKPE